MTLHFLSRRPSISDWFDDLGGGVAYAYPDASCQMPTLGRSIFSPTETRIDPLTGAVSAVGYWMESDSAGRTTRLYSPGPEFVGTLYYPRGPEVAITDFVEMTPGLL